MENHLTLTELRRKARESLSGNWGIAVLSNLIVGLILWIAPNIFNFATLGDRTRLFREILEDGSLSYRNSLDTYDLGRQSALNNTSSLISFVIGLLITGALTYGLTKVFLNLKRGEKSRIEMIFDGFKKYKESFLINLLLVIFKVLWGLLWGLGFIILIVIMFVGGFSAARGEVSGIGIVLVLCIIGMLALSITYSIFINRYAMTYLIALDNEGIGSMEALEESIRIMKGNKIRYFLLQLSVIWWVVLGVIVCISVMFTEIPALIISALIGIILLMISLIWVTPYMKAANVAFYDDLIGRNENDFDFKLTE
ncbi:Uncharacterized membrane protein [Clostridium cavendishii DSM 21758]|uniref:Uncharacterized membrane protein n=1 Tax=Clostridium cavendishii DSM 21758 TaxID=1121302 RepID=A0A1M6EA26_9CLOT|nr:DUF975 family protein [Clostridium cavendishii]SHI82311.1 Uncharacterized membrane protein [Clostridium cavendishii DSM 21758]